MEAACLESSDTGAADEEARALSLYSPPPHLLAFAVQGHRAHHPYTFFSLTVAPGAPQGTFYVPNFIDSSTEEVLLQVAQ